MEEILKKIIEIDNNAKNIILEEKNRKENIDNYIENEYSSRKQPLEESYNNEMNKEIEHYRVLFEEKKAEIDADIQKNILEIENNYKENKEKIIQDIVSNIKKGE